MMKTNTINKPDIQATVLMHVIDGSNYEVMDVGFNNKEFSSLMDKYTNLVFSKQEASAIRDRLTLIDNLRDMACGDLYENGEVSTSIHRKLWKRDKTERFYCINVNLIYTTTKYDLGEVDVSVDYNFTEVEDMTKEWEKLDLLQKGTKIYPIDYEISQKTYTIDSVYEVHDNDYMKTGLYYTISNDALSNLFHKHSLNVDLVDICTVNGRFFTTPSLAHEAYLAHEVYVACEKQKNECEQER